MNLELDSLDPPWKGGIIFIQQISDPLGGCPRFSIRS